MPRRPDAELIKTSKFKELEFYIMPNKIESTVYYDVKIDLSHTKDFMKKYNKNRPKNEKLTLFQLILAACVRTITLKPKINRFISGKRLWQRNQILLTFVVNKQKEEGGEEVVPLVEFDPYDTLESVRQRVAETIHEVRYGENKNEQDIEFFGGLPRFIFRVIFNIVKWLDEHNMPPYFMTKDMPFWSTGFVANLGSIGIDAVYHHLYNLGTASIFLVIGKIKKEAILNQETEEIEVKEVVNLRISLDERILSGVEIGPIIDLLKKLIEHPETLMEKPDLTAEQLDALKLKKYKKERMKREKERKKKSQKKLNY